MTLARRLRVGRWQGCEGDDVTRQGEKVGRKRACLGVQGGDGPSEMTPGKKDEKWDDALASKIQMGRQRRRRGACA